MKILEANNGAFTNFEVLDFLRAKGASKDPTRVLAKVAQSEYKVGGQAGRFSNDLRLCWKYLHDVSVLSSIKSVFAFAVHWPNFRGKYQMLMWNKAGISNVAGKVALLAGLAMIFFFLCVSYKLLLILDRSLPQ
ncbi:hypothetical protein S83_055248, partial [Arachis hypogaea]